MTLNRNLSYCLFLVLAMHSNLSEAFQEKITQAIGSGDLLSAVVAFRTGEQDETFAFGALQPGVATAPDNATAYQIGSITKAFTHLLLAEMTAQGQVQYSTTVADILGEEVEFANSQVGAITLKELATHSSGLPRLPANLGATDSTDPYASFDEAKLLQAVSSTRALQPLGDHYGYSNFGAGLLGYLLGRVHGGGYQNALAELVIEPLGMAHSGFEPGNGSAIPFSSGEAVSAWSFDALAGAGALWSDAEDLIRLATFAMDDREWPLEQSIDAQRELLDVRTGDFTLTPVWHSLETETGTVYWHNGGTAGHRSFLGFRPETDEAIVLLFSGDADPTTLGMDWFGSREEYADKSPDPVSSDHSAILGQYQLTPAVGIGIFEQSGRLLAQVSGQPAAPLFAVEDQIFALHIADASLKFVEEDGEVIAVDLIQNGIVQRAQRVADQAAVMTREEVSLSADQLAEFVGEYQLSPAAKFTIRQNADGLEAQLTGQGSLPIFPKGEDIFFYKVVDAELHFQRDDKNDVTGLVLHQGGRKMPAERL